MNIYRLCGDMLHVVSILLLMLRLLKSKNCAGVSCRMQEMYLIVFVCRYLDLFWAYYSLYNSVMKVIFILSTGYLVYLMRFNATSPVTQSYDRSLDNFPYEKFLLPPCFVLSLLTSGDFSLSEVLWTFSIWAESVSILPQLLMLQQSREVENLTGNFVAAMGAYRAFYILNWAYRYLVESHFTWQPVVAGVVQTGLYIDFFYYYAKAKWYGHKLILPE
jgi:ER lumen protein retaining receptor